ncbi:MurR/RpiR family transcriptional regulator [Staphylococcus hyicus]|uniref:MurR/RpiR family transcriptional regulator n=1 Tax=Staphylococcus hyicus TaxID=1284 RepID=UPI00208EDC44|nr:MurR/RpiR family transcriptional regulator [Staphylococcus hyicus]MCO4329106.1 MurR/RpiR family transcriptional regulator [Staphylococcus hyicus]MCO4332488.1 MurR/RpiR family transcriptional regulator [Staphylococcus hyicus]MCO4334888.1 MurR/RpiR family transcriptional regulator [Staphylococcus hyicus]MCO4335359.1 MurR/RpiR family transcriptional regulator [Staphylococcus hyicus]MCQ9301560.1 MurR/RpiR family transcriptional regulator [Staphylococcus hyicus]
MKLENRIQHFYPQFTKSERLIAEAILKLSHASDIGNIQSFARDIGVSPSSVSRFAHKLDYDSFQSLRFAIQHEYHQDTIENEPAIQIMHQHYMAILNHTGEFIIQSDLMALVEAIQHSQKVIFIGIGSSGLSAQEFYFRTIRMGFNVVAITDAHLMAVIGQMCNDQTTVVAITNSGATSEVLDSLKQAHKQGAKILALSHYKTPTLEDVSDHIILTADRQFTHDHYFINSQLATHFIIDLVSYHLLQTPHRLAHYSQSYNTLVAKREKL